MRLLAVTVWAFVCVTLLGVLAYSMLLWSQYWRWATPRNTGARAAVPRRWSHFSRGYSNASLSGGVLHPHRMAPLPKDKLFAKVWHSLITATFFLPFFLSHNAHG